MTREASSAETDGSAVGMILDEADSSSLARRGFIKGGLGVAGFAAASAILAACGDDGEEAPAPAAAPDDDAATTTAAPTTTASDTVAVTAQGPEVEWEMATSWPTALVTLFGSAQFFAQKVGELTGGRFVINARPAGEIAGGLEVLPVVRDGGAQVGHTASYYYVGLSPVQQFGTAVPFGLTQPAERLAVPGRRHRAAQRVLCGGARDDLVPRGGDRLPDGRLVHQGAQLGR